jgi:hypothetical protein
MNTNEQPDAEIRPKHTLGSEGTYPFINSPIALPLPPAQQSSMRQKPSISNRIVHPQALNPGRRAAEGRQNPGGKPSEQRQEPGASPAEPRRQAGREICLNASQPVQKTLNPFTCTELNIQIKAVQSRCKGGANPKQNRFIHGANPKMHRVAPPPKLTLPSYVVTLPINGGGVLARASRAALR